MANFDFAVVKAAVLNNGKADKNGLESIILDVVAGKMPRNRVLSGTIADREGFTPGSSYMVSIQELPSNEYGEQYRFSNLGSINGLELIKTCKELGKGIVVDSSKTESLSIESITNTPITEPATV